MGISRGFHSGVHVLDACLVGAARAGRKKKKKRQERQEKGFYGQAKGKMLHCSRGRRELFLFALKCSVWDRLFFFFMLYPSYCNCTNLHLFHVGFHLCSCPTLMLLLLRCFIYLFSLFVVVLDDIYHYKTFFSS